MFYFYFFGIYFILEEFISAFSIIKVLPGCLFTTNLNFKIKLRKGDYYSIQQCCETNINGLTQ